MIGNDAITAIPIVGKAMSIKNPSTGLVIDVAGGLAANGTPIIVWWWNGGTNQRWIASDDGVLIGVSSGLALSPLTSGKLAIATGTTGTKGNWNIDQKWSIAGKYIVNATSPVTASPQPMVLTIDGMTNTTTPRDLAGRSVKWAPVDMTNVLAQSWDLVPI
jgi:hypothetical protein